MSIVASTVDDVHSTAGAALAGPVAAMVPSARGRQAAGRESEACQERTTDGQRRDGLVICAKSRRARDREARKSQAEAEAAQFQRRIGLRFPSPEMVSSAAAMFEKSERTSAEAARFLIMVSPGVVRLSWRNPAHEKSSDHALVRRAESVADWESRLEGLLRRARALDPAALAAVADADWSAIRPVQRSARRSARVITSWSRKSRSMMCRVFAELDYTPLIQGKRVPAMVTLTYPGDWETVAPDGATVKRHLDSWRKRYERAWGEKATYIWKLEFQGRGAPHIHLWMAPPLGTDRSNRGFAEWLSWSWSMVVNHPDPAEKRRHRGAGTRIDTLSGLRARDPKRLAIYFTKHSSPNSEGDKEYQHIVPEAWQRPGKGPGRFWGVYGLRKATAAAEIAQNSYLMARRIIRRWSRSQAIYSSVGSRFPSTVVPRTAFRQVARVDRSTGRVTYRRVRRRRLLCDQGGLAGGYALLNDGPAFASQLARAVI
ncbi:Uncharacterised protein [Mycobacteroides abscessus subsp. massiliense]|uniref:rolling circle replication-associated protein n=3 Tax=Mycobacteroides abscessus TaxID=36809 RepID=UPI0009D47A0A|nr:hypothetical protein [Mycobacteroides abscessus]MDM2495047.1 hypothetical protein [Mycobacteroides abscessus]MDM2528711.1 hypothetical protein [Mycobacteroides abscessus]MDM2531708.1 hypothetical protein [Mycobacteroides abscessus]MDM2709375.1 hypothetical protein [Mycobacteroides abscessus]MDM2713263.1 hypothetical protein [Mycobacteroides abscessus]